MGCSGGVRGLVTKHEAKQRARQLPVKRPYLPTSYKQKSNGLTLIAFTESFYRKLAIPAYINFTSSSLGKSIKCSELVSGRFNAPPPASSVHDRQEVSLYTSILRSELMAAYLSPSIYESHASSSQECYNAYQDSYSCPPATGSQYYPHPENLSPNFLVGASALSAVSVNDQVRIHGSSYQGYI